MATNLLPVFSSASWSKSGLAASTIQYGGDYICSFHAVAESDYIRCTVSNISSMLGKALKIGYGSFTSADGEQWLQVRSYVGGVYTTLVSGVNTTNVSVEFTVPLDCEELRIYVRHDYDSDGFPDTLISIAGLYLEEAAQMSLTALNFHKVLKSNLPACVDAGEEHIYFTSDGTRVEMYITDKNGYLIQVNLDEDYDPGAEYYNAFAQYFIDERYDEIQALTKGDYFSFLVATDMHVRAEDGDAGRYNQIRDLLMVAKQLPVDYIAVTGDILGATEAFDISEPRLNKVANILTSGNVPVFFTRGNHDYNSDGTHTADIVIQNKQWYNDVHRFMVNTPSYTIHHPNDRSMNGYFFVDDTAHKHRMIFINTFEIRTNDDGTPYEENEVLDYQLSSVCTKQQLVWLLDEALDMTGKTGWIVSFYSHALPYTDIEESDLSQFHGYGEDEPELRQIIAAFQAGTSIVGLDYSVIDLDTGIWNYYEVNKDFSVQGATPVIGFFAGHIHDDCYDKIDNLNLVVSTCTCASRRTYWPDDMTPTKLPPERNTADLAMSANLFIVLKSTKTVYVIKIGSKRDNLTKTSSDYSFTYA